MAGVHQRRSLKQAEVTTLPGGTWDSSNPIESERASKVSEASYQEPALPRIGPLIATLVVVAVAVSTAIRLWFTFHQPLNSDELIGGLMAREILHGHFSAFYWGQVYGGGEPYVIAGLFAIFGQHTWVVRLCPELLAAVSSLLTWRVARRLVSDRGLAILAGAVSWCFSDAVIWNSSYEWGFRGVTMACGMGALLFSLRIFDGRRALLDGGVFGLFVGLGWWSSPEITYFFVPIAILLVVAFFKSPRTNRIRSWIPPASAAVLCAVIGALPWIWVNVGNNWISLKSKSFATPPNVSYAGNLGAFFGHALPIEFGLRLMDSGTWLLGNGQDFARRVGVVILLIVVVGAVVASLAICLFRDAKSRAVSIGILAFPAIYAANPGTWYWNDARYIVYLGPFVGLALAMASEQLPMLRLRVRNGRPRTRRSHPRLAFELACVVVLVLVLVGFHQAWDQNPSSFFSAWVNPDAPAQQTADALVSDGIEAGYANYWIAYKLDFVGGGGLEITTTGADPDRSTAIDREVSHARHPAWLFVPDNDVLEATYQFGTAAGPDGQDEAAFLDELRTSHIGYRVVVAGLVEAVIPDRPLKVTHST